MIRWFEVSERLPLKTDGTVEVSADGRQYLECNVLLSYGTNAKAGFVVEDKSFYRMDDGIRYDDGEVVAWESTSLSVEQLAIMAAFDKGARIQSKLDWCDEECFKIDLHPTWCWDHYDYRIEVKK